MTIKPYKPKGPSKTASAGLKSSRKGVGKGKVQLAQAKLPKGVKQGSTTTTGVRG